MNFRYEGGIAATDAGSQEVGRDLIPEIMDAIARDLGLPHILRRSSPSGLPVLPEYSAKRMDRPL
jgi:hypothetical protein